MNKVRVNIVSESDISVQGHGVHTAYTEMASALEKRDDVVVTRGKFGKLVECDIVHLHTIGLRTIDKLFQRGPRKVISAHVVPASFVGSLKFAKYWLFLARWYMRWYYNRADKLLAVSDETKQELEALGVRPPIEIVYNFIDTSRYQHAEIDRASLRKQLGIPENAFVVIGAGQVQPRKRVDCFVQAARKFPDIHFVWVGGIPFGKIADANDDMQAMMEHDVPENMHFTGIIDFSHMPSYYKMADLFWLPSEQETFGLVVVEAAASGLPVLLRNIPDYDKTFTTDAYYHDNDDYAQALTTLSTDKTTYAQYKEGAARIAARFDSSRAMDHLVAIYQDLMV